MRALLGFMTGVVISVVGVPINNWRWWVLLGWVMIHTLLWKYLDEQQAAKEGEQ